MRKFFYFFVVVAFVVTSVKAKAAVPASPLVVSKATGAITIDGAGAEAAWSSAAWNDIAVVYKGDAVGFTNAADFAGKFKVLYDVNKIYFFFDIADDIITQDPGAFWAGDRVEIYFGLAGYSPTAGANTAHSRQFAFKAQTDPTAQGENGSNNYAPASDALATNGVIYSYVERATGYTLEVSIDRAIALESMPENNSVAFDVCIADNDQVGAAGVRYRQSWYNDGAVNELWSTMHGAGQLKLSTAIAGPGINLSNTILSGLNYNKGNGPSSEKSFSVSGTSLTSNIVITPPANFQISKTSGSGFVYTPITLTQSAGVVAATPIYVRLKAGLTNADYTGDIVLTSMGNTTQTVTCSGTVVGPTITPSTSSIAALNYDKGNGPSSEKTITVGGSILEGDIVLTPSSTNLQISETSGSGFSSNPLTLTQSAGNVSSTTIYVRMKAGLNFGDYTENITIATTNGITKNVACTGTVKGPTITQSTNALSSFSYSRGFGPSTSKTLTVGGTLLEGNIVVTPSTNYEISTNNSTFVSTPVNLTPSSGTVVSRTIYVRLKAGLSAAAYSESISISSTNATTKTVACSGTVLGPNIVTSVTSITGLNYDTDNGPSDQQSFLVSGSDLTTNIVITPNSNFQISIISGASFSTNAITLTRNGSIVNNTTIYVRLKAGLANGNYNNDITITSTNADSKTIACSGLVSIVLANNAFYPQFGQDAQWNINSNSELVFTGTVAPAPTSAIASAFGGLVSDGAGNNDFTGLNISFDGLIIDEATSTKVYLAYDGIWGYNAVNLEFNQWLCQAGTNYVYDSDITVRSMVTNFVAYQAAVKKNDYNKFDINVSDSGLISCKLNGYVCDKPYHVPVFSLKPQGISTSYVLFGNDYTGFKMKNLEVTKNGITKRYFFNSNYTQKEEITHTKLKVYSVNSNIIIDGTSKGELVRVYDVNGKQQYSGVSTGEKIAIPVRYKAIYLVKTATNTFKVIL